MSITNTDKVLLGITVAIATVAAATVRMWMAFPVLFAGVIASVALVRFLSSPRRDEAANHEQLDRRKAGGFHSFGAFGPYRDGDINPATGLPMRGMFDAAGNRWMHNRHYHSD